MLSAMELYSEHGFEQTTAADIAQRAGVTERTFFRYFADKREVLFAGSRGLQDAVVGAITSAPVEMTSMEVASSAMESAASRLASREYSRQRALVIAANPSLQERELLKLATLAGAIADALRLRGVPKLEAGLAAEAGVTVFKIGFELWIGDESTGTLAQCMHEALDQLKKLTAEA